MSSSVPVVGDQREADVGGGVVGDLGLVDGEGHTAADRRAELVAWLETVSIDAISQAEGWGPIADR